MAFASYWKSDDVALSMSRARRPIPRRTSALHNLVEGLCIASGLPKPRVYIIDDPAPNAFATGRNPRHAAIAVTTGLLEKMNRVELEGVLAHELSPRPELRHPRLDARRHDGRAIALSPTSSCMMCWNGGRQRRATNERNNPLAFVGSPS